MMRFPVLMVRRRRAEVAYFTLRRRSHSSFVLGDELALRLHGEGGLLNFFLLMARRYFPRALYRQVDWPSSEQAALADAFKLTGAWRLEGDSWFLPLLFALACAEWGRPWPAKILASGAIRQCRGLRCVSVGGAVHKLRRAQSSGCLCFLPKSNVTQLRRRNVDMSACLPLPCGVDQCLELWRRYV